MRPSPINFSRALSLFGSFGGSEPGEKHRQTQTSVGSPLIPTGASPAQIAGSGKVTLMIGQIVTFDPVRGGHHTTIMKAAVINIEAGSLWAVERTKGAETLDSWS